MKSISGKIIKIVSGLTLIGAVSVSIYSCSSRDGSPGDVNTATATLKFNIVGIDGGGGVVANASINGKGNAQESFTSIAKENTVGLKDFDVLTSIEKVNNSSGVQASASVKNGVIAASQPMTAGVKYLILIYNAGTTTNPVVSQVATAGTNPSVSVPSGSYDWYVVSTNDGTSPSVNASGIVSATSIANKDVLYAKSSAPVTVQSGQNDLAVVFHRNTARIDVNVDARGLFGKIGTTTTVELGTGTGASFSSIVQTGDLNIFDGTYSNKVATPAIVSGSNMVNTVGAQGDLGATKTASFYTVNTDANAIPANISVRLATLGITMDDTTTRTFTGAIVPYTSAAVTPVIGSQYLVNATMVESGLSVAGTGWGRTNLQYLSSAADKYRFLPTNDIFINQALNLLDLIQLGNGINNQITNLYWNWNSITPTGTAGSGDPCGQVYPVGMWKTPTQAQLNSLGTVSTDGLDLVAPLVGPSFFGAKWTAPSPVNSAFPAHSQQLFMPMYGYRNVAGTNILDTPSALVPLVSASVTSNYWSSSGTASNAIRHFRSLTTILTIVSLDTGYSTSAITASNTGMSLRCVRS